MKVKKRLLSLLLAAVMALPMASLTANAAEIETGQADLTVNQSKVAFAGHEWWVIGYNGEGVYSAEDDGHITLLAANADEEFQKIPFRIGGVKEEFDNSSKYSDGRYYANNPEGMAAWTTPNEYAGSTLQQKLEAIAKGFPEKEYAAISARSFVGGEICPNLSVDEIVGQGIDNQKIWPLSNEEWTAIGDSNILAYDFYWWLRSPKPSAAQGYEMRQGNAKGTSKANTFVEDPKDAARPAFSLNLSSVLFTSSATESGKSSATVGGGLVGAEAPTGTVKFTMKDESQTLNVEATTAQSTQTGETLSFRYSGATTGINQYISCVLTDDSGAVKYYGKLADSSSAASGALSVPLAGVADGAYTLKIFSEEANGAMYTDFCSEPVTMKVAVSGGSGTVSEFGGTLLHEHSWSDEWQKNETHHWHECTAENCPVTDNSQKDGYAEHTYDQTVAADEYLKSAANCESPAVYYKSCVCGAFSESADTFTDGKAAGHTISHVEAKAPTAAEEGNIEYWYCTECNRYFSDKDLTKEIQKKDTILAATGTTDPTDPSKPTDPDKENPGEGADSPQTGDSSDPLVWSLLTLLSGGAVLMLTVKRRKRTNQ